MPHHSPSSGTSSAKEKRFAGPIQDRRIPGMLGEMPLNIKSLWSFCHSLLIITTNIIYNIIIGTKNLR
jgi:hypothetical protein